MAIAKVEKINDRELLVTSDTGGKSIVEPDNPNSMTPEFAAWLNNGGVVQPKPGWEPTLAQAQARRTKEIRIEARRILAEGTDWYIIRKYEAGTAVPPAVTAYRAAVRQAAQSAITAVNALASIEAVRDCKPGWPAPVE